MRCFWLKKAKITDQEQLESCNWIAPFVKVLETDEGGVQSRPLFAQDCGKLGVAGGGGEGR